MDGKQLNQVADMSSRAAMGGTFAAMFTTAAAIVTTVLIVFIITACGVSLWAHLKAQSAPKN